MRVAGECAEGPVSGNLVQRSSAFSPLSVRYREGTRPLWGCASDSFGVERNVHQWLWRTECARNPNHSGRGYLISSARARTLLAACANPTSAVSSCKPSEVAAARCSASKVRKDEVIEAIKPRALIKCSTVSAIRR